VGKVAEILQRRFFVRVAPLIGQPVRGGFDLVDFRREYFGIFVA